MFAAERTKDLQEPQVTLELQYYLPPAVRPLTARNKEEVLLVYQLNKNGLIDAVTGKPLELKQNQYLAGDEYALGLGYGGAVNSRAKSVSLTPAELQEIEDNTKLLTQEEAVKIIQKWVEIPSNYSLRTMNLNTDGSLRDTKVWYFEWAVAGKERLQSITARVDAVNGELIAFNFYSPRPPLTGGSEQQVIMKKKEAQTLAEEFLQKIQPTKFKQTKLQADNTGDAVPEVASDAVSDPEPQATSVSFNYQRTVNGITFPSNVTRAEAASFLIKALASRL